jgi:hypothetical protein
MTSTIAKDASNGAKTETKPETKRDYGIAILREREAKALISLACDSMRETSQVTHQMFGLIYDRDTKVPDAELQQQLDEALSCWQTADHYLRMLGSVLEERIGDSPAPWRPTDSAF